MSVRTPTEAGERRRPPADSFPDADAFCARVERAELFAGGGAVAVSRAPGRLDVLGGIADYSGSLVLGLPIAAAALAGAQLRPDGRAVAVSGGRRIAVDADELLHAPLEELAQRFTGAEAWAAYVLGPIALLVREAGAPLPGLRLLLSSAVPEGKGVGSSAAVEVAALLAVSACLGRPVEPRPLALLGQRAEQLFAGAPCGVMDQMTVACGEAGELLALLCRPAEAMGSLPLPPPLAVWGIDSGTRHAVAGVAYRRVRCAAFMGKALLGCREEYLAAGDPSELELARLPEQLAGAEFLRDHDGVEDPASVVEPEVVYPVRAATVLPIEEHARVRRFAELLAGPVTDGVARLLGGLMVESHESYSRCGLGTAGTDAIFDAACRAGWRRGVAGARVSGGGSGGAVVVLGRTDAEPAVRALADELGAGLIAGTSPGAARFGIRTIVPAGSAG